MRKSTESFKSGVRFLTCSYTALTYELLSSPSVSRCFAHWGWALGFLFCMPLAKCSSQHTHDDTLTAFFQALICQEV